MARRDSHLILLAVPVSLLLLAAPAAAQQGEWQWRGRVLAAIPDDSSDPIANLDSTFTLDTAPGIGGDIVYGLSRTLAASLSLDAGWHQLATSGGGEYGGLDVGTVWITPLVATLQYRPPLFGNWHPYLGAGLAYCWPFGFDLDQEAQDARLTDVEFEDDLGFALQAGVLYDLSETSFIVFDLSKLDLSTEATLSTIQADDYATVEVVLDPWMVSLGVGWRF